LFFSYNEYKQRMDEKVERELYRDGNTFSMGQAENTP